MEQVGKGKQGQDQGRGLNICKTKKWKWKEVKWEGLRYQGGFLKENGQRVGLFITELKEKVVMNFRSYETLGNNHCYLGLRPTVDIALIPLCHTCFSKENQVQTYMHARIKFHAYSDI
jgi:hypothetical protein